MPDAAGHSPGPTGRPSNQGDSFPANDLAPAISARIDRLGTRYRDAYRIAEFVDAKGQSYKAIGVVVGLIGAFGLMLCLANLESVNGIQALSVVGIGLAFSLVLIGGSLRLFASGVALAAQGQMMMATLDTAVHTSPFFTRAQMLALLSRD